MPVESKVWLNKEWIPWDKAKVHIMSHSFSRGSAIFEVMGVHQTASGPAIFRLPEHIARLFNTAEMLGMRLAQSVEEIQHAVAETVKANALSQGFIKIVAYYGEEAFAKLVPDTSLDLAIFAIPITADLGLDITKPISACICKWRKLHPETVPVAAKACAYYLNGMLSRQEAFGRGFDVGLMLDTQGFLAEGAIESVFMVKDGVIMTPPLGRILPSISRKSVLEAAQATSQKAMEKAIRPEELLDADEIFTSATPFKVLPVGRIEDRIIENTPGPVTRRMAELMRTICDGADERFKDWLVPV